MVDQDEAVHAKPEVAYADSLHSRAMALFSMLGDIPHEDAMAICDLAKIQFSAANNAAKRQKMEVIEATMEGIALGAPPNILMKIGMPGNKIMVAAKMRQQPPVQDKWIKEMSEEDNVQAKTAAEKETPDA